MRTVLALMLIPAGWLLAQPQWDWYGLEGRTVYDLRSYGSKIYAATDTGVFVCTFTSEAPVWTLAGLAGKSVRTVYPHDVGPLSYAVTAGIYRRPGDVDSCVIYCSMGSDTAWAVADTGINRSELNMIESIDGFPDPRVCGETFAGGSGKVYRRSLTGGWEKVFDFGVGIINVVRTRLNPPMVMAGGEGAAFNPFITRSTDKGDSWETAFPDLAGDNACNSLMYDPLDSLSVFAGMEGAIIRSTDGGKSWISAGLESTPYYIFDLEAVLLPSLYTIFAVGASGSNEFAMFYVTHPYDSWFPLDPPWPLKGGHCMVALYAPYPEASVVLLIGTLGDGVVRWSALYSSVEQEPLPSALRLHQNYPNPFNSSTVITYEIPARALVVLELFDPLGRRVAVLEKEEKQAGPHSLRFDAGEIPSGFYICRLSAGGSSVSRSILLIR